jgi:hypothetical protein
MKHISIDLARSVDTYAKVITTLALVLGACWTLYQYNESRQAQLDSIHREARRPLLEKRLNLYFEIANTVGVILANSDKNERRVAVNRFIVINQGPIHLTSNTQLRESTAKFASCLQTSQCGSSLEMLGQNVLHLCYESTLTDWPEAPLLVTARQQ